MDGMSRQKKTPFLLFFADQRLLWFVIREWFVPVILNLQFLVLPQHPGTAAAVSCFLVASAFNIGHYT